MPASSSSSPADGVQQRQRIVELEQALEGTQQQAMLYQSVLDSVPSVIYSTDLEGKILLVNQAFAGWLGQDPSAIVGKHQSDLFPADLVAYWQSQTDQVIQTRTPLALEEQSETEQGVQVFFSQRSPIFDAQGNIYAIAGMATDITELRRAEREREMLQVQVIEAQQAALRELSTPLIPIAEDVVVMPLIGSMDSSRAEQVLDTLLEGVSQYQASSAILDITGLPVVDTQVASVLLQAARAVRLLGAEVILTGIGPEVAQTLVSIGADLSTITTPGTLQSGITYALDRRARPDS